jgi:DNA polymerase III delta prime subunit
MSKKIKKLTPSVLRKLVLRETLSGEVDPIEDVHAEEVDADEHGTSKALAKDIDHAKVLKLEERRLVKRLRKIKEARKRIRSRIIKGL